MTKAGIAIEDEDERASVPGGLAMESSPGARVSANRSARVAGSRWFCSWLLPFCNMGNRHEYSKLWPSGRRPAIVRWFSSDPLDAEKGVGLAFGNATLKFLDARLASGS